MLLETTLITVPSVRSENGFQIDLKAILTSETRQEEVAIVTVAKAPELLSEFNRSWRDLHGLITQLSSEKNTADKEADKRRAILLLEEAPPFLKARGLQSNEANRDAFVTLDEEYQRLTDIADQLEAIIELLRGKMKSFDNSYSSVKKILGGAESFDRYRNEHLTGDSNSTPVRPGFGKPKY